MRKCQHLNVNFSWENEEKNKTFSLFFSSEPSSTDSTNDGIIRTQVAAPRVRHYFVFSLFSALCLCPATGKWKSVFKLFLLSCFSLYVQGLIALAYSLKSSAKADVQFHDKARLYSRRALIWNLCSVVFAFLSVVMVLIICYYFNEAFNNYNSSFDSMFRQQRRNEINNEISRMIQSFSNEKWKKL